MGANAIGQIGDLGLVERLARLVRIARDGVAIEPDLAVLVAREAVVAGTSTAVAGPERRPSGSSQARPNRASKPRPKRRSFDTANPP